MTDRKKTAGVRTQQATSRYPVGDKLNFAAAEAYKLLRTNLIFSFPEEGKGHVVGITSALRGEGKSLTAVNLAYSLAETGKNVLLIEADMRLPSISRNLKLSRSPGLSNVLVGMSPLSNAVQKYKEFENFSVIVAGDIPVNPSELLGSQKMQKIMEGLAKYYEYIIVDLPPVTAVSDPVAVSKFLDGMVVIVRNEYTERGSLEDAIRQLQFVGVRIIGFVFNCVNNKSEGYSKKYGKKYKYNYKYSNRYVYESRPVRKQNSSGQTGG